MVGATSAMRVIRSAFSQWPDTIDSTLRCDWLQVASVETCNLQVLSFNISVVVHVIWV